MPPFFLDNLYKYGDLKDGVIRKDTFITKYRDLVETFMIKYNTYHNDLEYFKKFPKQRLEAKHLQYTTIMVDKMEYPMEELKDAYGDLWNAEVSVHSAPVAWNDQKNMISDKSQSIFDFIKERGHSIFYRKTNQSPNLLAIAAIYKK